jgi:hypothetical protein
MKARILLPFIASLALPATAQTASNSVSTQAEPAPGSVWSINVIGLKGEPLGNLTIQLLNESGNWSCGGREWKARLIQNSVRSVALAREFETKSYFPTYRTNGARLTINFAHVCDYSLYLSGNFTAREGKGDYAESKRGSKETLGTFTAKRRQQ